LISKWLSQFDGGLENVRKLRLYDFDPANPDSAYVDSLLRCTKLEDLTLAGPGAGPSEKSFVCLTSARQFVNDSQVEVVPQRSEDLEMYRGLRRLRRLEWITNEDGRRMDVVSQFKLPMGNSVEVYMFEALGGREFQRELLSEDVAVCEVQ
jgi:hypothetical protein